METAQRKGTTPWRWNWTCPILWNRIQTTVRATIETGKFTISHHYRTLMGVQGLQSIFVVIKSTSFVCWRVQKQYTKLFFFPSFLISDSGQTCFSSPPKHRDTKLNNTFPLLCLDACCLLKRLLTKIICHFYLGTEKCHIVCLVGNSCVFRRKFLTCLVSLWSNKKRHVGAPLYLWFNYLSSSSQ